MAKEGLSEVTEVPKNQINLSILALNYKRRTIKLTEAINFDGLFL